MKKFKHYALLLLVAVMALTTSCGEDYDDTAIKKDIADLQSRVEKLETWCTTVNGQISALQGLVTALEAKDYVTGVSPTAAGDGYTITFSKSGAITIYNGKDGADGITPTIGVGKDTNGLYYWTIKIGDADVKWLEDAAGNKIRTTGDAGKTPEISVATNTDGKVYWKVDGKWLEDAAGNKVQATGDKGDKGDTGASGSAGKDGDSVFATNGLIINKDNGTVTFTLAGENGESFTLPMVSEIKIFDNFDEFKVNDAKCELTLALNVKDGDYAALKAELTSSKGMTMAIVKATTRSATTPWGVSLTEPTFNDDKTIKDNGKVTFNLPTDTDEGEFALLKVTVVTPDGKEHSSTRVIVYTIAVEKIELASSTYINVNDKKTLTATVVPAKADQGVIWKSSNEAIATVDNKGEITAKAEGTTIITATSVKDNTITATCEVAVLIPEWSIGKNTIAATGDVIKISLSDAHADDRTVYAVTCDASGNIEESMASWITTTKDNDGSDGTVETGTTVWTATIAQNEKLYDRYAMIFVLPTNTTLQEIIARKDELSGKKLTQSLGEGQPQGSATLKFWFEPTQAYEERPNSENGLSWTMMSIPGGFPKGVFEISSNCKYGNFREVKVVDGQDVVINPDKVEGSDPEFFINRWQASDGATLSKYGDNQPCYYFKTIAPFDTENRATHYVVWDMYEGENSKNVIGQIRYALEYRGTGM